MVTIQNASVYSINNGTAMAYQIDYSEGTSVRVVEEPSKIIRNEYKTAEGWKQSGKAYIVRKDKKRQGERIIEKVKAFVAAVGPRGK
jgi:hypothetical protein